MNTRLLEKARAGDRDAQWAILLTESATITGIARAWIIPGLGPEDILQEARIAALEALRTFDPERGSLRAYFRRCIPRHLSRIKDAQIARHDEPTEETEIMAVVALPERELSVIRSVWPFLTESERRGVLVALDEGCTSVVGANANISKQAVSRGWKDAQRLIQLAYREGLQSILVERPNPRPSPLDWQLEELLSRLSA